MNDLEKRLSIIEEKLGIVNLENQFEKKEGKWYKASYKSKYLVYAEKLSGNDVLKGYGFCDSGNWHVFTGSYASVLKTIKATHQEVEEALIKEAKRRYKVGTTIRDLGESEYTWLINSEPTFTLSNGNILLHSETIDEKGKLWGDGYIAVYISGDWAEVIDDQQQESSLEQDIQQLKDKYKQYKFTITIEDNI